MSVTGSRSVYEWSIGEALSQPDTREGLANRIHHARVAIRTAETAGRREFARTQYRAAVRSFGRIAAAERSPWRSPLIGSVTFTVSLVVSFLIARWLS